MFLIITGMLHTNGGAHRSFLNKVNTLKTTLVLILSCHFLPRARTFKQSSKQTPHQSKRKGA